LSDVARRLGAAGWAIDVHRTREPGEATGAARAAAQGGAAAVFVLGGDGTVREVAAGLLGSSTALGVLPAGTTNVVAIALGLPLAPGAAADLLARAGSRPMDVGLAGGHPFLMQATAGFDAYVVGRLRGAAKARFGKTAVAWQAAGDWLRYGFPEIELQADGSTYRATHVAICNIAHYAGRYRLARAARWDDGRLDLRLFSGRGRAATLASACRLLLDRDDPRARAFCVERVRIVGPTGAALQIDGDPLRLDLPVDIALAPHRLQVLAPPR
jgi:diacylglycerol kinase family enzyme